MEVATHQGQCQALIRCCCFFFLSPTTTSEMEKTGSLRGRVTRIQLERARAQLASMSYLQDQECGSVIRRKPCPQQKSQESNFAALGKADSASTQKSRRPWGSDICKSSVLTPCLAKGNISDIYGPPSIRNLASLGDGKVMGSDFTCCAHQLCDPPMESYYAPFTLIMTHDNSGLCVMRTFAFRGSVALNLD